MSNEELTQAPSAAGAEPAAAFAKPSVETLKTAGSLLRRYRTDHGVELAQMAAVLKVKPEKLDALENDRYDELPDMVFIRALAMSFCRILHEDPAPVMALFPQAKLPALAKATDGLNQPFKHGSVAASSAALPERKSGSRWAVTLVGLLLLGAAGVYLWPGIARQLGHAETPAPAATADATGVISRPVIIPGVNDATSPEPRVEPVAPASSAAPVATTGAEPAAGTTAAVTPIIPATSVTTGEMGGGAVQTANTPEGQPSRQGEDAQAQTREQAAASAAQTLRIVAKDAVWIQVRGNNNALLRQATVPKGQELVVEEPAPLRVEVGRVNAVDVFVNGQPFDLKPFAKGNVARFEVTP